MKKVVIFLLLMLSVTMASAEIVCDLDISLINQDPYPASPGDYVKLVFQLEGIDGADCNDITFNLLADYPIEFNPGESGLKTFERVKYLKDYETNILIPYEVRINKDALDGTNPIEVRVQSRGNAPLSKIFDMEIEDARTNFEVYVKDYSYETNELTLEILNIEGSDIEALSVEIPKQDNIQLKGANRIVVGDLDSNEYTTAEFEAILSDGKFQVNLIYSDTINVRRAMEKTVSFDSSYFIKRKADQSTTSSWTYIFWTIIIILLIWWIVRKSRKKKKRH